MATKGSVELNPIKEQPRAAQTKSVTFWDLVEEAVKAKFRSNIQVIKLPYVDKEISKFKEGLDLSEAHHHGAPTEVSRVLVDINVKEYENHGDKENDETMVRIEKTTSKEEGRRYNFSATTGRTWGLDGNIGINKILQLGVGGNYSKTKEKKTEEESSSSEGLSFSYNQEEKIVIPPGKRATVKVETHIVRYQQKYTLKYKIAASRSISATYRDLGCYGCCCGSSRCTVTAREILRTLPNFKEEAGFVYFTQDGLLEWVGEGCNVTKNEFLLQSAI